METESTITYEVCEAKRDDVEAIRRMQARSWRDTYRNDKLGVTEQWLEEETARWLTVSELNKSKKFLGSCFEDPSQFYRVAKQLDEVVGLIHVSTKKDGLKHLWGLYTAKETHGTGLAQQLMLLADNWIDGATVDLGVAAYNERAKAFYRKHGFEELPDKTELFRNKIPAITMIRKGHK